MPVDLHTLLKTPKTLHLIGIGGSGMYPIAQILHSAGHIIQGSDNNEGAILDYERALGMRIFMGHKADNIDGADLVIYSAAIPENNPERLAATEKGIPCFERSIILGYVSSLYNRPLCIGGTHGKTTATGMSVQILEMAGLDPAAVIGGRLPLINGYGKAGGSDRIVVEACEYHNTFHELRPHTAVLLNVDNDHLEFFKTMDNLKAAFAKFCNLASHAVIYNADDENSVEAAAMVNKPVKLSFGIEKDCDFKAFDLYEYKPSFWAFRLNWQNEEIEIRLGAPGRHNVYNGLAAAAGAISLGASLENCAAGLAAFGGTGRRFEVLGVNKGITIIDDYAHHPTELKAALSTAKGMGYKSVWAVFQPYTYSRTQLLLDQFAEVLPIADHVVMTKIMGGREKEEDYNIKTADLAAKIDGSVHFESQEEVAQYVMANAENGDLVITLGCGDIYKCAKMMLNMP